MIAKVMANIEINPKEMIEDMVNDKDNGFWNGVIDVTMDDVISHLNDKLLYIKPERGTVGISEVAMGWAIDGLEESAYEEIESVLEEMKDKAREEMLNKNQEEIER